MELFFFIIFIGKYFLNMNNLVDTMEGFFSNISNSPNIDKITKLFNDWIEVEYDLDLRYVSNLTHYIPSPVFEFDPKKFTFSIYSNIFKRIRYDIQISDFIKEVMASTDSDNHYIFGRYIINEDKSVLNIQLEYKNGVNNEVVKRYVLNLIPSPFKKIRDAFSKDLGSNGWIIDAMGQLEVKSDKTKYKVEDIKKAIKEIYDLL